MAVYFEWTGGNSQFDAPITRQGSFGAGPNTPILAEVADPELVGGRKLRLSASGTGDGAVIAMITDPIVQIGAKLLVEMRIAGATATHFPGVVFLSDPSAERYQMYSPYGMAARVDGTGVAATDEVGGAIIVPRVETVTAMVRLRLEAAARASAPPRWRMEGTASQSGGEGFLPTSSTDDSMIMRDQDFTAFGSGTLGPYPAAWNSVTPTRMGICLIAQGGQPYGFFDIESLRILDDPLADGAGGADGTPPVVTYPFPEGAFIDYRQAITVDVTDNAGLLPFILMAEYMDPSNPDYDVVYDGTKYADRYRNSDAPVVIPGGFRYTIRRSGGWPRDEAVRFIGAAVDTSGNQSV